MSVIDFRGNFVGFSGEFVVFVGKLGGCVTSGVFGVVCGILAVLRVLTV